MQKSPIKPPPSAPHNTSVQDAMASPTKVHDEQLGASVDELQGSTALFCSPAKKFGTSSGESPSKALDSPSKAALQRSPRKFVPSLGAARSTETRPAKTESVMVKPAQKFPMSAPPKQPVFDISKQAQSQTSMFTSPAKRPAASGGALFAPQPPR